MQVSQAVILAAGRGIRLGELGRVIPKGLIDLGGEALLDRSIRQLMAQGIERISIVTGHLAPQIEALAVRHGAGVQCIHNHGYETGGSFASMLCALAQPLDDVLLLESDIVYEARALEALQGAHWSDAILTSGPTAAGDEVWVATDGGRPDDVLSDMSKSRGAIRGGIVGELAGICRLSAPTLRALVNARDTLFRDAPSVDYESALVHVAPACGIRCVHVPDLIWAEIDTPQMLDRVRAEVWPRLRAPTSAGC